jgi:hypothetical protein
MKKLLILILTVALSHFTLAQNKIDFGVKAGINYNSNGKLYATNFYDELYIIKSRARVGYNFGVWLRGDIPSLPLYIQPEVLYTQTKSTYIDFNRSDFSLQKLEIPVLFGIKVLKIAWIFAGPDFQFILNSDFDDTARIDTDSFSLALNVGIGFEIGKLGLDIRLERGLSKIESIFFNDFITVDSRSSQLICGLKYQLSN